VAASTACPVTGSTAAPASAPYRTPGLAALTGRPWPVPGAQGIDVVVIEPGGIRTEWGGIAADKLKPASSGGPYARQADAVATSLSSEANARRSSPPSVIADTIAKAVTARRPRTRYAAGYGARPIIFMHDVLPDRAFDAFIRQATGVPS
jgi:hypothetical protein